MILKRLAAAARQQRAVHEGVLACRHLRDRAVDRWLGICTESGAVRPPHNAHGDSYACDPIAYPLALQLLRSADLRPADVVYDIGCGKGRIVCMAARRPVQRCVGVELNDSLAIAALENARRLHGRLCGIEIIHADATTLDYRDGTLFVMHNPFGPDTMREVLDRIRRSLRHQPREVRIAYGHPMHNDVLEQCPWLVCTHVGSSLFHERPTTFWRSVAPESASAATPRHERQADFVLAA